jgi:hypothetical protein
MTEQHTPGPWFVTSDASTVYEKDELGCRADTICRLVGNPFAAGNARLIEAAPELLDALMVTIDAQINAGLRWDPEEVAAARAARAKARGTQ